MSKFSEFSAFERIEGSNLYALKAGLIWEIGKKGSGWEAVIKSDFLFDLSVPWWLTWFQSRHDRRMLLAACVHDYLLSHKDMDRPFAAGEFRRACRARGVSSWRSWLTWLAVLIFTSFKRRD